MKQIFIALLVGGVIGLIFRLLKLPVPVPHGWTGMAGLIGMFIASEVFPHIITYIKSLKG